jgi:hypothetical protein
MDLFTFVLIAVVVPVAGIAAWQHARRRSGRTVTGSRLTRSSGVALIVITVLLGLYLSPWASLTLFSILFTPESLHDLSTLLTVAQWLAMPAVLVLGFAYGVHLVRTAGGTMIGRATEPMPGTIAGDPVGRDLRCEADQRSG